MCECVLPLVCMHVYSMHSWIEEDERESWKGLSALHGSTRQLNLLICPHLALLFKNHFSHTQTLFLNHFNTVLHTCFTSSCISCFLCKGIALTCGSGLVWVIITNRGTVRAVVANKTVRHKKNFACTKQKAAYCSGFIFNRLWCYMI